MIWALIYLVVGTIVYVWADQTSPRTNTGYFMRGLYAGALGLLVLLTALGL